MLSRYKLPPCDKMEKYRKNAFSSIKIIRPGKLHPDARRRSVTKVQKTYFLGLMLQKSCYNFLHGHSYQIIGVRLFVELSYMYSNTSSAMRHSAPTLNTVVCMSCSGDLATSTDKKKKNLDFEMVNFVAPISIDTQLKTRRSITELIRFTSSILGSTTNP